MENISLLEYKKENINKNSLVTPKDKGYDMTKIKDLQLSQDLSLSNLNMLTRNMTDKMQQGFRENSHSIGTSINNMNNTTNSSSQSVNNQNQQNQSSGLEANSFDILKGDMR